MLAAVIVETRSIECLEDTIANHLIRLPNGTRLYAFGSQGNRGAFGHYGVIEVPLVINSLSDYSRLLASEWFWEQIEEENILIFQHDSQILRCGIELFYGWDYVGAPWQCDLTGGNGGLSFRHRSAMLECVRRFPNDGEPEDVYFCRHLPLLGRKVAPRDVAQQFSVETAFGLGSFGCHAIRKHLTAEQCLRVLTQYDESTLDPAMAGYYRYKRKNLGTGVLELCPDGSVRQAPGHAEQRWSKAGDTLIFHDVLGTSTAYFWRRGSDWEGTFMNDREGLALAKATSDVYSAQSVCLRLGCKSVKWVFHYGHDYLFFRDHILPWAMYDRQCDILPTDSPHDFVVGVYLYELDEHHFGKNKPRFLISAEPDVGYLGMRDCFVFVSNDMFASDNTYYCPPMVMWAAPHARAKTRKCSALDSGRRPGRLAAVHGIAQRVQDVDFFGPGFGRPLGYHPDAKSACLMDYAFSIAVEHSICSDYITEKLSDIVVNEGVGIYRGALRLGDYYVPESVITEENVGKIDWGNWQREYDKRRPYVLMQKELIRTMFNVFRYFDRLTDDMSLLSNRRPLTLRSALT